MKYLHAIIFLVIGFVVFIAIEHILKYEMKFFAGYYTALIGIYFRILSPIIKK